MRGKSQNPIASATPWPEQAQAGGIGCAKLKRLEGSREIGQAVVTNQAHFVTDERQHQGKRFSAEWMIDR